MGWINQARKAVPGLVAVFCPEDLAAQVRANLRQAADIRTAWPQVEEVLPQASAVIVIQAYLSDASLLNRLRKLRADHPLTPLAVVCHAGARNFDVLVQADVRPQRFLDIGQLDLELSRLVQQFESMTLRGRLVEAILEYCSSDEARKALHLIFEDDNFPRSDAALAANTGCGVKRIRTLLKTDLGQTPHRLRRWSLLIRAAELWNNGIREPELSEKLGVASTTLAADSRALVETTFGKAAQKGANAIAARLVEEVRQHRRQALTRIAARGHIR
jgi:AraC-like DNA-binding protein